MSLFFITLRRGPTFFTLCAGPHPRAPTATRSSLAALVSGDCPFSLWFCAGPRALPPARLARAFALVRAAGPACSLKLFRAFVFSWLHLFLSSCHKQPGALRVSVRRKRDDSGIHEACIVQHTPYVIVGKAEPDVTHLLTVALAIVREHVDDNRATAGLERADDLRERVPRPSAPQTRRKTPATSSGVGQALRGAGADPGRRPRWGRPVRGRAATGGARRRRARHASSCTAGWCPPSAPRSTRCPPAPSSDGSPWTAEAARSRTAPRQ